MITNFKHDIKAIMTEYIKPVLYVILAFKFPDWIKMIFDAITTENISACAVFISQVGGAIFMLLKIYDWIHNKVKKNEKDK